MLSEFCVRRPVSATMLVMSLVVLGTFSFRGLGVDLFPKADPATVSVTLLLPGASPDEMSSSVVEPMEEAISGVSGIDEIQSRIAEGRATLTVRFVLERDLNDASNDVREKVAGAIRNAPPALLPPVITKVDPDADPVLSLIVSSPGMSLRTLTELADKQIARAIQTVNGVGQVSLSGGRAREVHVVVDIEKLNSYGLSMTRGARRDRRGERRDSRRHRRAGKRAAAAAHARPGRRDRELQRHRGGDQGRRRRSAFPTSVTPRTASSVRPRRCGWVSRRRSCSTSAARWARTPCSVIEGVRERLAAVERSLPPTVKLTVIRDDSQLHLRVDLVARGAPAVRRAVRDRSSSCSSSATCAR